MIRIHVIPVLSDNYSYVIENGVNLIVVDPGEAAPVREFLEHRKPGYILLTHHHGDHIGGVPELKIIYKTHVIGPAAELSRMSMIDQGVRDGDIIHISDMDIHVIATPGHTSGHCAFWIPQAHALFSGDTLFSLGCGRLFEGTPQQMRNSLQKLAALPENTLVYCGHEYTGNNGQFALSIDPQNQDLLRRIAEVKILRDAGKPTLPVALGVEKKTNPFLRTQSVEEFARLRAMKDQF